MLVPLVTLSSQVMPVKITSEGKENTSAPVLISCNIDGTEVDLANIDSETENDLTAGTDGYVELCLSKAMRQTPPTRDGEKPVKC